MRQLGAYESARSSLKAESIKVIAASVDTRANAEETADRLGLSFPIGYELPLTETAKRFGAYYEKRRSILHATGFVIRPTGKVAIANYSSGPIGRLEPADVVKVVRFYKSKGM